MGRGLRASGVPYTQRGMAFDAVDALGYGLPEFALAIAPEVIHAIEAVLIAWIGARATRKVRIKVGDTEVEARTVEEAKDAYAAVVRQVQSGKCDTLS